jgi:hypothetical protein
MQMPPRAVPLSFEPELHEFLSISAHSSSHAGGRKSLREAIDRACTGDSKRGLWPGTNVADAAGWTRDALVETIDGFYRREEIRESITSEERLAIYRAMVLARVLDDALKRLFQEKKQAWNGYPSPQKGFRSLGQEACAGLGLRLRRGREGGDAISPMIRDQIGRAHV